MKAKIAAWVTVAGLLSFSLPTGAFAVLLRGNELHENMAGPNGDNAAGMVANKAAAENQMEVNLNLRRPAGAIPNIRGNVRQVPPWRRKPNWGGIKLPPWFVRKR